MKYIRGDGGEFRNYLRCSVSAERAYQDGCATKVPTWLCDGSQLIDSHDVAEFDAAGWRVGGSYRAPEIYHSILLDHHSIYARRPMPVAEFRSVQYGPAVPFEGEQELIAFQKVISAAEVISLAMPQVA